MTNSRSSTLVLMTTLLLGGSAASAPPPAGVSLVKGTVSSFGSGTPADANGANVPNIPPGQSLSWQYAVTNTGMTSVPFANVVVTDDQPGVTPGFISVVVGDTDNMLEPGEQWLYQANGSAFDLSDPPAGVGVVPNACTHGGTERPRTAYVNVATVTIPGATDTASSFYCNPVDPDVPVAGHRLRLTDADDIIRRKNLIGLQDEAIDLTGLDPTVTGVTVTLGRAGGGPVATFDLPASGWRRGNGAGPSFRYRSKSGAVSAATMRHGKDIRVSANGPDALPLEVPQAPIGVIVEIDGVRFCAVFGGAISQNDGRRYHARFAPAPDECPVLGGF